MPRWGLFGFRGPAAGSGITAAAFGAVT